MRIKNVKTGRIFPSTVNQHGQKPSYYDRSLSRINVTLNGENSEFVVKPDNPKSRVNFMLDGAISYSFVDNTELYKEIAGAIDNKTEGLEYEVIDARNGGAQKKTRRRLKKSSPVNRQDKDVGPCTCDSKIEFAEIGDLEKVCETKVACDNVAFGINSRYLPNPLFSKRPKVCFIGLEPSDGPVQGFALDEMLGLGFKNFVRDEEYIILHFCAFEIFGEEYAITDFSKGAMAPKDAPTYRDVRFERWLPILKNEIAALGNPFLVALGVKAKRYLDRFGFKNTHQVGHPSPAANGYFRERAAEFNDRMPSLDKFRNFSEKLLDEQDVHPDLATAILGSVFQKQNQTQDDRYRCYLNWFKNIHEEIEKQNH